MVPVSDKYLDAIQRLTVTTNWRGTIRTVNGVTYTILPANIVEGSGKITRQICTGEDIQIGTTCAAELDLSLYLENVERYSLYKATVTLYFELLTEDGWEAVPLGIFTITEPPERSYDVITIHAYDNMLKFNASFGATLVGNPYYMLNYCCNVCGVELGTTQDEITNFVNGTVETYNFEEVEVYTYRDFVGNIASYLCCFAYIGVDGKLYLKPYGMTADRSVSADWRYTYKPKDYEAYYTSISAYFAVTKEYETITLQNGGLDYDLGTNPIIQFNADEVRRSVLTNIITKLAEVSYTPFTASLPCDPSLMVGDVLNFTDNHAVDGKLSAITKQVIRINGSMEVECVGTDPNLNVLTEKEKQITNAARNSDKDAMLYYDYANADTITIGDGQTAQIILFEYTTTKKTHVDFHAEIKCLVETTEEYDEETDTYTENDGVLSFIYRQGGDLVTEHYPVDTHQDGIKLVHLLYAWWSSGNILGTFEVRLKCTGCSVTIDLGASRGYIAGVGLVGDNAWDGSVHIYQDFIPVDFSAIRKNFTGEVSGDTITPDISGISQAITKKNFSNVIMKSFTESLSSHGLHRFTVPYNDGDVSKDNVVASGTVWQNIDNTTDGILTTPDCLVERILRITSRRTSNSGDVTYLMSFDHGETWYTYTDGFVEYQSGYGMVKRIMESIPEAEWTAVIADTGAIMVRAILQDNATLTDIDIYIYDAVEYASVGPEEAEGYDAKYISANGDIIELITGGYTYNGIAMAIDTGNSQSLAIDSTAFSAVRTINVTDTMDGILTNAQRDMSNWSCGLSGWQHTVNYLRLFCTLCG